MAIVIFFGNEQHICTSFAGLMHLTNATDECLFNALKMKLSLVFAFLTVLVMPQMVPPIGFASIILYGPEFVWNCHTEYKSNAHAILWDYVCMWH